MITELTCETVAYEDGKPCPCCDRPRVFRQSPLGLEVCGTGEDSGRVMSQDEDCWTCRGIA